jgi:hypothetical protein
VAAFEQSPPLERVDEGDHATRRDLEPLRERLLGLALGRRHRAQQRELARFELERGKNLLEAPADRVAERGEHEADCLECGFWGARCGHAALVQAVGLVLPHPTIISERKDLWYRSFCTELFRQRRLA